MRTSQIQVHPRKQAIEAAIVQGLPVVRIAEEFKVSPSSIYRHQQNYLAPQLREAMRASDTANTASLIERIANIASDALTARTAALDTGQLAQAIKAGDHELRALAVLLDRLGIDSLDTLELLKEGEILARAVGQLARKNTQAGHDLADALARLGADDMADSLHEIATTTEKREIAS